MVAFLEASLIFSITKDTHSDLNAVMRWHKSRVKQIGIMRSYIPLTPNCADDAVLLPILELHPTQAICRCGPFLHSLRTHRGLCLWHARELCKNGWSDLDVVKRVSKMTWHRAASPPHTHFCIRYNKPVHVHHKSVLSRAWENWNRLSDFFGHLIFCQTNFHMLTSSLLL